MGIENLDVLTKEAEEKKVKKKSIDLFNRDLSWLSFNERVLMEAADETVPLYERLKFIAIYSSNIDEFYRVRFANIRRIARLGKKKFRKETRILDPEELTKQILRTTYLQGERFGLVYRDSIIPALADEGIILYQDDIFEPEHIDFIEEYFYSQILSFIQPILLIDDDKELFLENRKLYHAVELEDKKAQSLIGIVNIPSDFLGRFVSLPKLNGKFHFAFIDDIVRYFLPVIFSRYVVKSSYSIKLNRDAELYLENELSGTLIEQIKENITKRDIGVPARFLYDGKASQYILGILMKKIKLELNDMVPGGRYHNMFDHFTLPNPLGETLEYPKIRAIQHKKFTEDKLILNTIAKRDVLLNFPYQRYDYILRFFNEASLDSRVEEIKVTLYRVAKNSHIVNALISAAMNGKKVTVFVEAKARFDEANNLKWAGRMKEVGIDVRFSELDLKVHAKVALIISRKSNGTQIKYAFLGTGNFNEKTASLYCDHALLTTDESLTNELDRTFDVIFREKDNLELDELLVSRINMFDRIVEMIDREIENHNQGLEAGIVMKMNNIQDPAIISHIYRAAEEGVEVNLLVRAICCIKPLKNIRIIRLVDRYLEHARILHFCNNGENDLYLGSADIMERNLYRRIEVAFPIKEKSIKRDILKCLKLQLKDNTKAVTLDMELNNVPVRNDEEPVRAQFDYAEWLKRKNE
ncbi:MAG: polyphosphate kinase [Flavobacteriales bacterium]